jgi:prepilin-type N-terminal cleavage/methylation domain-containing protein
MQTKLNPSRRLGLTLLELVVVVLILAVLAALVVPRLSGVVTQSNSAANAAVIDEVNRSVQLFETRFGKQPQGWDSLMNTNGTLYSKLHPNVTQTADQTKPSLQIATLTDMQAASLNAAGIFGFHDAVETRTDGGPSDNSTQWHSIASGAKVVTLVKVPVTTGHGSTFIDKAFSIDQYKSNWNNEYVVVGLGGPTSLKGATMSEIPLVQSANPAKYYSRVMCVYMVPGTLSTATSFTAQFVGSFMPDGTSLRSNVDAYNGANVTAN